MSARRKSHRPVGTEKEEFSDLVKSVAAIADSIRDLHSRALVEYTPLVDGIVQSHCRNAKRIEQTLDGLLDFCDHAPMLVLYKSLCRHYHGIDPVATASYVYAYRDRWDSDCK